MTDLTEQFNNDEIDESKLYYFKQKMSEEIEIGHPFALNMVRAMDDTYLDWFLIDKVIAPVPSYEVYKELIDGRKLLREHIKDTTNENTQLKELLKECREPLEVLAEKRNACDWYPEDLLAKIKQALGEEE